jgi:putative pantetheine hydrolase
MRNAITDVPGILVGHATLIGDGALTGTTVVLLPPGSLATVDSRGGAPATRETTALDPRYGGRVVKAIVLTGGSAYGLAAADGVQAWLGDDSVVPAAALFDLGRGGDFRSRPTAQTGIDAAEAASEDVAQGNVGAGTGALNANIKGGIGTASVRLPSGAIVAAIAVINAVGASVDPETGVPYSEPAQASPFNTVIGVVATNAALSPAENFRLANAAQDGLALAVRPAHTLFDGDTIFAVTTGTEPATDDVIAAATDVFARALAQGVFAAESVTTDWGHIPSYH